MKFKDLMGGAVFDTPTLRDLKKLNSSSAHGADCPRCGLPHWNAVDWLGYLEHICADVEVTTPTQGLVESTS